MDKKKITFVILIIVLASTCVITAETTYLGKLTPSKEVNVGFMIEFNENDIKDQKLILEFQNSQFLCEDASIPLTRLQLNLKNQRIEINSQVIELNTKELINDAAGYYIPTILILKPFDKPGIYSNVLKFKTLNGELIKEEQIFFEINSWTKFEFANANYLHIMNENLANNKLSSNNMLILKVASNTNWELYGLLNEEGKELINKLSVIASKKEDAKNSKIKPVLLNENPKLINCGKNTVTKNNYWDNIDIYVEIQDINNIKAGFKNFPIIFFLETIN